MFNPIGQCHVRARHMQQRPLPPNAACKKASHRLMPRLRTMGERSRPWVEAIRQMLRPHAIPIEIPCQEGPRKSHIICAHDAGRLVHKTESRETFLDPL